MFRKNCQSILTMDVSYSLVLGEKRSELLSRETNPGPLDIKMCGKLNNILNIIILTTVTLALLTVLKEAALWGLIIL